MTYNFTDHISRILTSLSQLGAAISNADEDTSISACTGYYYKNNPNWFWKWQRMIIDFTFEPIDGKGHCEQAARGESDEKFKTGIWWIMGILTLVCCIVICVFTYSYKLCKVFKKN